MRRFRFPQTAATLLVVAVVAFFPAAGRAQEQQGGADPPPPTTVPEQPPAEQPALDPEAVAEKLKVKILFTDGVKTVAIPRADLGFKVVSLEPVRFEVDRAPLKRALEAQADVFKAEARNAKPYTFKGEFHLDPGQHARALNVPTTAELFARAVEKDASTVRWQVTLNKTPPALTAEALEGIDGVLASFSSVAAKNASRDNNIAVAVASIHGMVLKPGETFSLNQTVGERTKARGFQTATVFVNAKPVPGVGGGVSQVTGTLFNAAALAGLTIDEVNPHSRPVAYLPLGRDATVAYGDKDLRFTNNTDAPIYITYTFRNQTLSVTLFGKKTPGEQISLRPSIQRLGPGKINAQLYRIVKQDGKVISKSRLFSHAYRWQPGT